MTLPCSIDLRHVMHCLGHAKLLSLDALVLSKLLEETWQFVRR